VAGEGEEHLVQGRLVQGHVLGGDAGGAQPAQRLHERGWAIGRREHHPAAVPILGRLLAADPPQHLQGPGPVPLGHGHLQHRAAHPVLELVGGAFADQPAVVDDGDPVGQPVGLLQVLGGEQHRGAALDQVADQPPEVAAAGRVQAGGRLVQQQHPGTAGQGGGQIQPPAHPARVGPDLPVGRLRQADAGQHLAGPLVRLAAGQAIEAADHLDVLPAAEDLIDGGGLAGQPDPGAHPGRVGADVDAGDAGAAPVGGEQGGEHADEGGLAGAVGPQQAVDAAGRHGERQAIQRPDLPLEHLHQALDLDDGIAHRASSGCVPHVVYF
jgi:hypothetical protein